MENPNNPLAFPRVGTVALEWQEGMTLRDYFAAKALNGMMSNEVLYKVIAEEAKEHNTTSDKLVTSMAFIIADEMLKQREQ